jgi:hypothetical protein
LRKPPTHRNDSDLQTSIFSHHRRLRGESAAFFFTRALKN